MKSFFTASILLLLFVGCGYLPASKQARKVVGEKVFVEVLVSLQDPENAVIIKDALRKAVITRFQSSIVSAKEAKTHLLVEIASIAFAPLQYDSNGYIVVYRTQVSIKVQRTNRLNTQDQNTYYSSGVFDFTIEPNAVITDVQRFDAITEASVKALDGFIAQVGAEGSAL